jgi:hypothetical protein
VTIHKRRSPRAAGSAQNDGAGTPHRNAERFSTQRTALELLFAPAESIAVVSIKIDGEVVLFEHYDNRIAADAMIVSLARVNLRAEVRTGIPRSVRPGTTIERAR